VAAPTPSSTGPPSPGTAALSTGLCSCDSLLQLSFPEPADGGSAQHEAATLWTPSDVASHVRHHSTPASCRTCLPSTMSLESVGVRSVSGRLDSALDVVSSGTPTKLPLSGAHCVSQLGIAAVAPDWQADAHDPKAGASTGSWPCRRAAVAAAGTRHTQPPDLCGHRDAEAGVDMGALASVTPRQCDSGVVAALSEADPLTASTRAAFAHLKALLREAQARHPSVGCPHGSCTPSDDMPGLGGLKKVAECIARWAKADLASVDGPLAASIGQSALHLQMLVGLGR